MSVYRLTIEVINSNNYKTYEILTTQLATIENFMMKEINSKVRTNIIYTIFDLDYENEKLIYNKCFETKEEYFILNPIEYPSGLKNKQFKTIDLYYDIKNKIISNKSFDKYYVLDKEYIN